MSDLAKRNEFGRKAELQTQAVLLDHFWVMKLSADLDGAVFLVQPSTRSVESLLQQTNACSFAVIQSKSCFEHAEVEISRLLVESPDRLPHRSFFISIQTVDHFGVVAEYFFSAEDVQSCFKKKSNHKGQEAFVFRVSEDKNFSQFQRKHREQIQMISKALSEVDLQKNQSFLKMVFELPDSGSVQPLMVQVSENQWQMRFDQTLFEFEKDENDIIHGWKCNQSDRKQLSPFLPAGSLNDFVFDPLNEEWIHRNR